MRCIFKDKCKKKTKEEREKKKLTMHGYNTAHETLFAVAYAVKATRTFHKGFIKVQNRSFNKRKDGYNETHGAERGCYGVS